MKELTGLLGLYIHIPFCMQKCRYCDFLSFSADGCAVDAYIEALVGEIALKSDPRPVTSLFIGGGTPSILPGGAIERILHCVHKHLTILQDAEITIEANPGTLTREKLREYRKAGCNRLSIGAQSTHDQLLARIGRIHTAKSFFESFSFARAAGFDNINVDLMHGLPSQSVEQHLMTLQAAAQLEIEHISDYALIVEEGTPLFDAVERGEETLPSQESEYEMERLGMELLHSFGYERYEVSNFAKEGRRCAHNVNYWLCGEYLAAGLGASAALKVDGQLMRYKNLSDMNAYISAVGKGDLPVGETQAIEKNEEMFEVVMLGLRLCEGVEIAAFEQRFAKDIRARFGNAIRSCEQNGLLVIENGFLKLTQRGMEIQNTVLLKFMEE